MDHVELFVPSRYEAAEWYSDRLGFQVVEAYELWAPREGNPLMISSDDGQTLLALFKGDPLGRRDPVGFQRVAFRVDGAGFIEFLERLEQHPVFDPTGQQLTRDDVKDHDLAYSIYFCDPYGHPLEVTSYDYEEISERLTS